MTTMAENLPTQNAATADDSGEVPLRTGKELLDASQHYAKDDKVRSWWSIIEVTAIIALLEYGALYAPHLALRIVASVFAGLMVVRGFIIFHDYQHKAILRGSKLAEWYFAAYGHLVLTPPKVWKETHNYHHAHNAKIVGSHVGGFVVVTTAMWEKMSATEQRTYKFIRHPINIVLGYFTVFMLGMVVSPLRRNPKKHWRNLFTLTLHFGGSAALVYFLGWQAWLLAYFLPLAVATSAGALLFYVQHCFPDVIYQPRHEWSFTRAALESSSFFDLPAPLHYFTGNIAYHHVHHLNATIPFYRLPEAMKEMPELSNPKTVRMADLPACFGIKLWDTEKFEMVGYPKS